MKKNLHALTCVFTMLCFFLCYEGKGQGANRVDIGKSFANISKLSAGGTFNPGDTIEIRVTIAVITQGTQTTIDSVQVFDDVPLKTTYINGSMRIATNQGLTYKGPFSENADSDAGKKVGSAITLNLGRFANGVRGGRIRSDSSRPSFFNSHCIMMAVYRVRINPTVVYGDTIRVGGSVRYRTVVPNAGLTTVTFPQSRLLVFQNNGYCPDGKALSATSDANGTFGSGTVQNRAAALLFGTTYIKQNVTTNSPQDYYYAIVNNSSANGSTNPNSTMPESPALRRVFGFWDIGGDHTNATNPAVGNAPATPGVKSGYFVMVNASYNTNIAYQETLNNLCPNTYYEFSAWIRNLCPRCSCDSMGRGSGSAGFIPYPGNDSSGVRPNLSFEIDGLAYYTTGDIKYNRGTPWIKYGFTFRTKPGQTTANFAIRNNSPGGGGNDWAIDDISVSHCGPSLTMNYNPYVLGCSANPFVIYLRDTVRSVYNNYTHFKWQKSNVGGTVWSDMTGLGTTGVGTPVLVNGRYQYVTALPPFLGTYADSGTYYRVIVATTAANLSSPTCAYNDNSSTMVRVINCGAVLTAEIFTFRGQLTNNGSLLTWNVTNDQEITSYEIERSENGTDFYNIGNTLSHSSARSSYQFTDPDNVTESFYRIKAIHPSGMYKYSRVIMLGKAYNFSVEKVINPVKNSVQVEVIIPEDGIITFRLISENGQLINTIQYEGKKGYNDIRIADAGLNTNGIFILATEFKNEVIRKKLMRVE